MILVDARDTKPCSYGEAIRALSDNRDRYMAMSRDTRAGQLGELPPAKNWTDDLPSDCRK